ncbi:DMT family transporter [Caldicoprobacter algeriensis]|uniref:DMT family transporter n=1 Tax=Caldicoprobacter algeriensis TaxID=699281 RepID=UPI0020792207|nr:DMT family transporter [Caldicoprobacter algeriensis]MCM8900262.1 DMT family transporter [Caldicoprobacter algeriensis]
MTRKSGRSKAAQNALANLAIIATVIFWGMSFVSSKAILNAGVPPFTMAFLRFLIASLILLPILKRLQPDTNIRKEDKVPLMLSALFGVTIYFLFETWGIKLTSAASASMIVASIPVFTICAEYVIYKNSISPIKWLGVLMSITGVYFIIKRGQPSENNPQALWGNLLMIGACLSWVAYILISKGLNSRLSGLALTTYQSLFGALFLLPLALLERNLWRPIPPIAWINIIYLAVFCSAISYFLYIYSLSHLDSVVVSSYVNLIPVVSALGGTFILGEEITLQQILGGLIVIAGVYVVNLKKEEAYRNLKQHKQTTSY